MTVSLGMIGIGGLGHLQAQVSQDLENVSIVAGADIAKEAREVFHTEFQRPVYSDYRQMLQEHSEELDAATIVTPHTLHYDQAQACLQHGLHVLVEKPMVTDVADARDLVKSASERGLVLQVGYQRHFNPIYQRLRQHVLDGYIGDIHTVNCYIGQDWIRANSGTWRIDPRLSGGGQLYDTGSHLLDALLWVTDSEPVTVTAQVDYAEPQIDVNSVATLECRRNERPFVASVAISGEGMNISPREGYVIYGTDGLLTYDGSVIELEERSGTTYTTEIEGEPDFKSLTRQKINNFAASVQGHTEPAVPGTVGFRVTAVTEAIYRAAESGTAVSVDTLDRKHPE